MRDRRGWRVPASQLDKPRKATAQQRKTSITSGTDGSAAKSRDTMGRVAAMAGMGETRMGVYLNPGSTLFAEAFDLEIFVDKTAMIAYLNSSVSTNKKYVCASRP